MISTPNYFYIYYIFFIRIIQHKKWLSSSQQAMEFSPLNYNAAEIRKSFPKYNVIYGLFSKSGFTKRMLDIAKENPNILLIHEDHLL